MKRTLGKFLALRKNYSAIVAPIINANQKLGAIEIVYENPKRYGEEARAILKAFAGYTSVAIQNLVCILHRRTSLDGDHTVAG
jgi:hypothetical protein